MFSFADLLERAIKRVHDLNVARLHSLGLLQAARVQCLEFARLSHLSDVITRVIKLVGLCHREVQVDVTVALQVVSLDPVAQEGEDLILHLVIVHQRF